MTGGRAGGYAIVNIFCRGNPLLSADYDEV